MNIEKLSNLVNISIGRTPSRSKEEYWGIGHKWVSIRDLQSKIIYDTKEEITDTAVKEARCKIVPKGTLLFSFKLTIGKMAFAGHDLFTNEAIAAFSIKNKNKLNSDYLYYTLKSANLAGSNMPFKVKKQTIGFFTLMTSNAETHAITGALFRTYPAACPRPWCLGALSGCATTGCLV